MNTIQKLNDIYYFAVYDPYSHKLKYSKYNFDFDLYKKDFDLFNLNKNQIFHDFLVRNETYLENKFTVKLHLKKYFLPISEHIRNYFDKYSFTRLQRYMNNEIPENYIPDEKFIENQFDLIYYSDDEIRRLQDFIDIENKYTKYNFNFIKYVNEFNIWGNYLAVFTDFLIRIFNLSNISPINFKYNNIPCKFKEYFINDPDLVNYINNYSITSISKTGERSIYNIDFIKYGNLNEGLENFKGQEEMLKEHYLRYGQFEKKIIPFIKPLFDEIIVFDNKKNISELIGQKETEIIEIKDVQIKKVEIKDLEIKDLEIKDLEIKEVEIQEVEIKKVEKYKIIDIDILAEPKEEYSGLELLKIFNNNKKLVGICNDKIENNKFYTIIIVEEVINNIKKLNLIEASSNNESSEKNALFKVKSSSTILKIITTSNNSKIVYPDIYLREYLSFNLNSDVPMILGNNLTEFIEITINELYPYKYLYLKQSKENILEYAKDLSNNIKSIPKEYSAKFSIIYQVALESCNINPKFNIYPITFGAAVSYEDGQIENSWFIPSNDFSSSLDPINQLISKIEERQFNFKNKNKPKYIVMCDQFGVCHAPFTQSRALLLEYGYDYIDILVNTKEGGFKVVKSKDLFPQFY
jgi:hypothetical protein